MEAKIQKPKISQVYDKLLQHPLGSDDTFRFHCTECGKCCKQREDILLTPYDLNRIARYLNIEVGQVIQEYCVWYVGKSSRLPVVAMNMQGAEQKCPFLECRKCKIHAAKPTVCALFPLGRVGTSKDYSIRYILQPVHCGTDEDEQTVREWLAGYGLEESEEWFRAWQKTIIPLSQRINGYVDGLSERMINMIGEGLLNVLYVHYNNDQDFMEQFHENVQKADAFLDMSEGTLRQFGRL